jgi:O-methyltransferase
VISYLGQMLGYASGVRNLSDLRTKLKAVTGYAALARYLRRRYEPFNGFYTLSPDLLPALVKAFNIQTVQAQKGQDLLNGEVGYYEFGMFRGFSFWFAEQLAREYAPATFKFLGFDSFAGHPEPTLASEAVQFKQGDDCGSYEEVVANLDRWGADRRRMQLYQGFYSTGFFNGILQRAADAATPLPKISICLIDVDLYISCVPVLEFIKSLLCVGSILLFDDFNMFDAANDTGERRAFLEFSQRHPNVSWEHRFNYGQHGAAFQVTEI